MAVKTKGRDFIGRGALSKKKQEGIGRKRCTLRFETAAGFALGGEPVLVDGRCIGYVTSGNGGYSIGRHIAYAYLPREFADVGQAVEIEYLGRRFTAVVAADPLY